MVRVIICHQLNTKTNIISGSEVSRLSVAIQASGSGTNYASVHVATFEGTSVTLTPLKNNPSFTTFSSSGMIVAIQTAGSTTIKWTYTKIG